MTQATLTAIPSNLDALLKRAAQRLLAVAAAVAGARVLAVLLGVVLAMLLLDAAFHFAAWVRIGLNVVLVATLLGSAVYVIRALRACRYEPCRAAVLVEKRLGVGNSALINAVHLAAGDAPNQSPALVQASIQQGDALAKTLEPRNVADTAPLKRALRNLAVVVGVMLVVLIFAPGIYQAGIPRYLAPLDPNPPFTTLKFEVTVEPDRVLFGHSATIHATVTGSNPPSHASVVFLDDEGRLDQRAPMSRASVGDNADNTRLVGNANAKFALTLDRAEQTRRFYIETPDGRSKLYTLEVFPVPQFEEVTVDYGYPLYTGWASDSRVLDADGIRVLEGTIATLRIQSNIPLRGGKMTVTRILAEHESPIEPPTQYKLIPRSDDPTIAEVVVPIRDNAQFTIDLEAEDGTPSNDPLVGSITAIPDAKPGVSISDPPQTVVVPENHTVEVRIKADDDVGVSRIQLTRAVNGWGSATIDLPSEYLSVDKATAGSTYQFELARLGAEPGDVITYFATAYDNRAKPNGPNQSADSALHIIQVISLEDYLEYERTKYRIDDINEEFDEITEELNELAEMRADILEQMKPLQEKLESGEALSPEDMKALADLQKQLEEFEEAARALREKLEARAQMPELYEFEKPYTEMLQELAEQLGEQEQLASAAAQALQNLQQSEQQPLDQNPQDPQNQEPQNQDPQDPQAGNQQQPGNQQSARRNAQVRLEDFAGEQDEQGNNAPAPFNQDAQKMMELTKEQLKQLEMADKLFEQLDRLRAIIEAQRGLEKRLATFENKEELDAAEQLRARELGAEQDELRRELTDMMREMEEAAKDAQKLLPQMSASAQELVQTIKDLAIVRDMKDAGKLAEAGEGRTAHTAADSAADKLEMLVEKCKECEGQGPGGGGGQLDGPLRLTPEQMRQALQQMAMGRGIPGLGPPGGQGPGSAMGQGGGSRAPMAVRGPNARPDDRGRNGRRGGRGDLANVNAEDASTATAIDAGTSEGRDAQGGYVVGVPERFRDEAAAYFRRLADENK